MKTGDFADQRFGRNQTLDVDAGKIFMERIPPALGKQDRYRLMASGKCALDYFVALSDKHSVFGFDRLAPLNVPQLSVQLETRVIDVRDFTTNGHRPRLVA